MATVPLSATKIWFIKGIPFANDYKNTRYFASRTEQSDYFASKPIVHTMEQASYQRQDDRPFVQVDANIDKLYGTNYMYFKNEDYGNRIFYAFVTHLEFKNERVTKVYFEIDVYQTWYLDTTFQPSFVAREHRKLWNSDGSPVINTIEEGLEHGLEYDIVDVQQYLPTDRVQYLIIVCKTPMHEGDASNDVNASVIGVPQPLTMYCVPFDTTNNPLNINIGDGDSSPMTPPERVIEELYKNEKAVNNIVSMYLTDYIGINANVSERVPDSPTILSFPNISFDDVFTDVVVGSSVYCLLVKSIGSFTAKVKNISANKYDGFRPVTESKLLMYPYTVLMLDDYQGNRMGYKLEYINKLSLDIITKGSVGLSNFVSYSINEYNHGSLQDGDFLPINNEFAVLNNNPNDVTVINDFLAAFLQGNRNSIENQKDSAVFNGLMNGLNSGLQAGASQAMGNPFGVASAVGGIVQGGGNAILELQGIEAKQKDIANVPPSIAKMGSNTAYNAGNGYRGIYIVKKQIKAEYRRKLTDFFNMYGYKANEVKVPNMKTRRYWNYVQTKSCIILGDLNNTDLVALKRVFDQGITLWHTDQVGNYSLENEVV